MTHSASGPGGRAPSRVFATLAALVCASVCSLAGSVARADAPVTTLEHGSWAASVTAMQTDVSSQGSAVSVCVHDASDPYGACLPCGRYTLALDASGQRAFAIGACDPRSGATRVTLVDRSALFDHGHVVPRPIPVTISAEILQSVSATGGAATTGGSALGCTASLRPYLRDLEHGTDVYLGPDRFRVHVLRAGIDVSTIGNGWMLVSSTRIDTDVDYEVIELASGETVLTGHASMVCASQTDTSATIPGGAVVMGTGAPALTVENTRTGQPVMIGYSGVPIGSPIAGVPLGGDIDIEIVSSTTGYQAQVLGQVSDPSGAGVVTASALAAGRWEARLVVRATGHVLARAQFTVADDVSESCLASHAVDRSPVHIDLEAGARLRRTYFTIAEARQVTIEAHDVSWLRVYRACDASGSETLVMHNRQADMGEGHARVAANPLPAGTYVAEVDTGRGEAPATIDITPQHIPVMTELSAAAVFGMQDGMTGIGWRTELDLRFDLGDPSFSVTGGVGVAVMGEHYECASFGSHGCSSNPGGSALDLDAYEVLLPAFVELGPPRDTFGFRWRWELMPGLAVVQGHRAGLPFSTVAPVLVGGGGFDIDLGPLTLQLRGDAHFAGVNGPGGPEVLGIGFVGSAGISATF